MGVHGLYCLQVQLIMNVLNQLLNIYKLITVIDSGLHQFSPTLSTYFQGRLLLEPCFNKNSIFNKHSQSKSVVPFPILTTQGIRLQLRLNTQIFTKSGSSTTSRYPKTLCSLIKHFKESHSPSKVQFHKKYALPFSVIK